MRDYYDIKINIPGGIASPGLLKNILTAARAAHVRKVRFGSRQQLLMTVHYEDMRFLENDLKKLQVSFEMHTDRFPNIISAYCGDEVFRTGQWLNAGEYHAVLDSFEDAPRLKVNISDSNQSFTPFFTGNLNFISAPEPHFWFLYVRPKKSNAVFKWRDLIYTNEIGRVAGNLEALMLDEQCEDEPALYQKMQDRLKYIGLPAAQELELPSFSLPYYEGFNRYESRTWLGLYRRDEQFAIDFLLDVCALCLKTRIGEICTTPWKSLIIKGIEDQHRQEWSEILGRHDINVRHAANELAWQTEDYTSEGSALKHRLIRHFDKNDTRTFGICFGIQTRAKSEVFGSILIKRKPLLRIAGYTFLHVYDLYHTENFNPNSRQLVLFQKGLFGIHLGWQLERLCRRFNQLRTGRFSQSFSPKPEDQSEAQLPVRRVHQCSECLSVYDPVFGDERSAVGPGTAFENLPENYCCATCDADKSLMLPIEIAHLNIA